MVRASLVHWVDESKLVKFMRICVCTRDVSIQSFCARSVAKVHNKTVGFRKAVLLCVCTGQHLWNVPP